MKQRADKGELAMEEQKWQWDQQTCWCVQRLWTMDYGTTRYAPDAYAIAVTFRITESASKAAFANRKIFCNVEHVTLRQLGLLLSSVAWKECPFFILSLRKG